MPRMNFAGTIMGEMFQTNYPVSRSLSPVELDHLPACPYQPSGAEAEESLAMFRKYMLTSLPMIYLPPDMSSAYLREIHPFLWFNIMTVTCKNMDHQLVMSDSIKAFIAQKMVVEHEINIDLLWGLLVFMAW